uniref:Threonine--tRNA ligase n=1 Tax=Anthurium amnicola TaxID=1678845 RepID=A0A1D1ZDA0_9ARAE
MDAKDEGKTDRVIAQAVSVCLAGLFLFPGQDDILGKEHLGAIKGIWYGRSLAQPTLAYLYDGLSAACIGKPFYGNVLLLDAWLSFHVKFDFGVNDADPLLRPYDHTQIYVVRHTLHFTKRMVVKTRKLRSLEDWCRFFVYLPRATFVFSSEVLIKLEWKSRLCQGVDLRLIGSNKLVLYSAHRCYLQIGQPRQAIPSLSHHLPIELRALGTCHDQVEVRTRLALWKISHISKVTMNFVKENQELLKKYVFWLRRLRSIDH